MVQDLPGRNRYQKERSPQYSSMLCRKRKELLKLIILVILIYIIYRHHYYKKTSSKCVQSEILSKAVNLWNVNGNNCVLRSENRRMSEFFIEWILPWAWLSHMLMWWFRSIQQGCDIDQSGVGKTQIKYFFPGLSALCDHCCFLFCY